MLQDKEGRGKSPKFCGRRIWKPPKETDCFGVAAAKTIYLQTQFRPASEREGDRLHDAMDTPFVFQSMLSSFPDLLL